jgi:hypothetical protein
MTDHLDLGVVRPDLAITAERGLLDFLTIEDTLTAQAGRREQIDPAGWPGAPMPFWWRPGSPRQPATSG